jgi:hypothetical protein
VEKETGKKTCGIVIPISAIDGCTETHWAEVLDILSQAITGADFEPNLVSHTDEVAFIQKTIIQNLYDNPIVVCDVSGKNSNVMFELGMRLAFDKPTIIVKDDKKTYSFDTSSIEHLDYPRDLRFARIVDFKARLAEKIKATHEKATNDSQYTTFLKHFGEFTVAKIEKKEIPGQEYILKELQGLQAAMQRVERAQFARNQEFETSRAHLVASSNIRVGLPATFSRQAARDTATYAERHPSIDHLVFDDDKHVMTVVRSADASWDEFIEAVNDIAMRVESRRISRRSEPSSK